jgi:hypothetical protein
MNAPPRFRTMQKMRRPMFWIWVAITIVVAGYIGVAAPFAAFFAADKAWVAAIVPPVMILLLGIGLAWLLFFVMAPGRKPQSRIDDRRHPTAG